MLTLRGHARLKAGVLEPGSFWVVASMTFLSLLGSYLPAVLVVQRHVLVLLCGIGRIRLEREP